MFEIDRETEWERGKQRETGEIERDTERHGERERERDGSCECLGGKASEVSVPPHHSRSRSLKFDQFFPLLFHSGHCVSSSTTTIINDQSYKTRPCIIYNSKLGGWLCWVLKGIL
jgi:hypothetical protein